MQLMAFLTWINHQLSGSGNTIADLSQIGDGATIPYLAEIICGVFPSGVVVPPPTARDKMQNISIALEAIQKHLNAKFTPVSVPLLLNNNQKAIMDVVWDIIYHYHIKTVLYLGYPDRFGIFKWVQDSVKEFSNVNIVDFTTSFKDALAFCALVSHYAPQELKFRELQEYKILDNFRLAFKLADDLWDVPKILDPKDMSADPDEISVIIYLCLCFYKMNTNK